MATQKEKRQRIRELYELERVREVRLETQEIFIPGEAGLEALGAGGPDDPVSNEGGAAAPVNLSGSNFGKAGKPTRKSVELEMAAGRAAESTPELAAAEPVSEAAVADESLWLDAYWATYGDPSMRALLRSQPEDASILEVVIGEDDRVEIVDTSEFPWRAICSLLITAADGSRWVGTGWLIGPRTLLTAGHCVHMVKNGGWASQIEVIPGRRGAQRPFGSVIARSFRSVRGWTQNQDRLYDYAAILLSEDRRLGEDLGWFGFAVWSDAALSAARFNISGYPGDKPNGTQWFHAKEAAAIEERLLTYTIDTAGGQSGAPVWIKQPNGSRIGIGIHTNGYITGNSATRISQPVYDNIMNWRALGS